MRRRFYWWKVRRFRRCKHTPKLRAIDPADPLADLCATCPWRYGARGL
jgi:hypothetical protein